LKITESTVALWSRVLQAVPGSTLVLKHWRSLSYQRTQDRLRALFSASGIDTKRLTLDTAEDNDESLGRHLARYAEIDIALDTFPFNGSTTTFEALWMGVPVVTLLGSTTMSRWGASLLERVGHPEWVGSDPNSFVDKAVNLAADPCTLATIRQTLRAEVVGSRLFDAQRVVRNFERVYRAIWRRWCAERRAG